MEFIFETISGRFVFCSLSISHLVAWISTIRRKYLFYLLESHRVQAYSLLRAIFYFYLLLIM